MILRFSYAKLLTWDHLLEQVDPIGYHLLATHLLDGHGFALLNQSGHYIPNLIRTPGYPAFIAAIYAIFGRDPTTIILFQIMLDSISCLLIGWCTHRLSSRPSAGLLAMILYALYPNAWLFSGAILTETVLSFVLICLLCLLIIDIQSAKKPHLLCLGILATIAILIKPNLSFLILLLPFCLCFHTRSIKSSLLVFVVILMGLSPWIGRNYRLVGHPILSTAYIDNFNHISAVATLFYARNEQSHPFTPEWEAVYGRDLIAIAGAKYTWDDPVENAAGAFLRLQQVNEIARKIVRKYPRQFAKSHWDGFNRAWHPNEPYAWMEILSRYTQKIGWLEATLFIFWQTAHWVCLPLIMVSIWKLRHQGVILFWFFGLAFSITFLPGVLSDMRFRFPVDHLLIILTAIGTPTLRRFKPSARF